MSDFWEGYVPEPTKPAPITKDELTEPLGCVVVRPLLANSTTPPAAQEDIQRLSALVRAQQITIDKLEQARSAPVQEPVAIVDEDGVIVVCNYKYKPGDKLYTTPPGAPVQEPVAFNAGVPPLYPEMKDGETISVEYTTPPAAQRPVAEPHKWVGLTPREIYNLWEDSGVPFVDWDSFASITRAIEAKLKEKNGWYRQHVIDGSPCWCEPETSYTDPETGASVVVHKEPQ
jgi:hypothetical protein